VRNGTNWSQQAKLKASNPGASDLFGYSVAIDGNTIVIGAIQESSAATGVNGDQNDNSLTASGAAYVFIRSGTNWSQQAYLKASNTGFNDTFGRAVAVSGNTIVVGADQEDSSATGVNGANNNLAAEAGAAYVFVRSETNWTQQAYLKASNTSTGALFGHSTAISGETIVVGAYQESSGGTGVDSVPVYGAATNSGAAYVFSRSGTHWVQEAYLKPSNTKGVIEGNRFDRGERFGSSAAIDTDTIVVGAQGEESDATGINGDQSNRNATNSGAAYVFIRTTTGWVQQAYIKASNTGADDRFGFSVSVSRDTLVAGAFKEDSNALGVNGNQNNESLTDSGAAYVFSALGAATRLAVSPDGSGGEFVRFNGISGNTYQLQRASFVNGPWTTNATITTATSGLVEFHDTNAPPSQAFYRVSQQ